jgi:maltose phosphorylase
MGKVSDRYLVVDPWRIVEDGFHPDRSRVSESLFSLSNEHMGVRGFFEEGYSGDTLVGCYLNGIYEAYDIAEPTSYKGISNRIAFMVNTVNWLHARIELGGEVLDLNRCRFADFRRDLDFRTGELRREFTWTTRAGQELRVSFARFLSMKTNELGFARISFTPLNFSAPITVTLGADFSLPHEMYRQNFWSGGQSEATSDRWAILGITRNIEHKLFAGSRLLSGAPKDGLPVEQDKFAGVRVTLDLEQGKETHIDRVAVLYTTRDPKDSADETWTRGMAVLAAQDRADYDAALAENRIYWQEFWEKADISVEGDPEAQQGIRFCIFQMQQTYRGAVEGSNIGAKGLTGEAYNGNAFWDTETYCLPYYLFSNPAAAKALIDFRYRTLPQAEERAHSLDCEGACYPIATTDGTESCTLWQHASLQFQPTTGVAYAIWHYVNVTGDVDFLHGEGIELLIPICRFLASRGQWSPRRNGFGYYAVMGPDEFQMMVNNNCYTNYMAKQTFLFTLKVLAEMGRAGGPAAARLAGLGCTAAEMANWQKMADQMIIPVDAATGVFEQHEGFFDLPHIDVDAIPVQDFPLYHNWSYDRIYRNDMIKQPDVLMFMFLHSQSFSIEQKRANYDYYEPRCIHESSLSPSLHSIFAAELGRDQEAFEFFNFATRIDLDNYNRNTSEGIHITSIAAAWMNVVYGYGGMRSDGDMLVFNPTIPKHWSSYSFRVSYRDSIVRVSVTQDGTRLELLAGAPVTAVVRGQVREIGAGGLALAPAHA